MCIIGRDRVIAPKLQEKQKLILVSFNVYYLLLENNNELLNKNNNLNKQYMALKIEKNEFEALNEKNKVRYIIVYA